MKQRVAADAVAAIQHSRLVRAALVRQRTLELWESRDYSAEGSSTLAVASPMVTNMFILAYGESEGLAAGERLEVCGRSAQLIRTAAYGCPRGHENVRSAPREVLNDITTQLNVIGGVSGDMEGGALAGSRKIGGDTSASGTERVLWRLVGDGRPKAGVDDSAVAAARRLANSNDEFVVGEWVCQDGSSELPLLVENGVCYAAAQQAGLRVLRAARLTYVSAMEWVATALRDAHRCRGAASTDRTESRPLALLDVSALDFSFSHAAVQATVELGLQDAAQCQLTYVPLSHSAAESVESNLGTFVHLVVERPGRALRDPLGMLPLRHFDVGAFTVYLDLLPLPGKRALSTSLGHRKRAVQQLAKTLSLMRKGSPTLVTIVPTPVTAAALHRAVQHTSRAEVAMEESTVATAKSLLGEAIARTGRCGYIADEVLPPVDCPQGSAVSLMVTMD